MDPWLNKSCVVIGDRRAGKTSFINKIHSETFSEDYEPTVDYNSTKSVKFGADDLKISIHEKSLDETADSIDPVDLVLFCIDVSSEKARDNLLQIWHPKLEQKLNKKSPLILIGTKIDLRKDMKTRSQIHDCEEGKSVAEKIGAAEYFECSAKNDQHFEIFRLFENAVVAALLANPK